MNYTVAEARITRDEMIEMFGEEMPIEAVNLIWDAGPDETIGQVRAKLREIAALKAREAAVDPLLSEAREMLAEDHTQGARSFGWGGVHHKCGAANELIRAGHFDSDPGLKQYLRALRRGMELAKTERTEPSSPPPKWVQDSIPEWAFARVAKLVGYVNGHGPRGSRAGVAFARYVAEAESGERLARPAEAMDDAAVLWPSEAELADIACVVQFNGQYTTELRTPYGAALEMARRLREYRTGGAA